MLILANLQEMLSERDVYARQRSGYTCNDVCLPCRQIPMWLEKDAVSLH